LSMFAEVGSRGERKKVAIQPFVRSHEKEMSNALIIWMGTGGIGTAVTYVEISKKKQGQSERGSGVLTSNLSIRKMFSKG